MVWTQEQHTLTENDHLGDWSPEKDCSSQDSSRPDDEVRFKLLGEKEFCLQKRATEYKVISTCLF